MKRVLKNIAAHIYTNNMFLHAYRPLINHHRKKHSAVIVNFHQFYKKENGFIRKGPSVHTHVDEFEQLLGYLKVRFEPISLDTLVNHLRENEPLDNDSFVITMDDGYENNLTLGLPVLKKLNIPSTLYIATGFIDVQKLLPMDRVDYVLRKTTKKSFTWKYFDNETLEIDTQEKIRTVNSKIGNVIKHLHETELNDAFHELYQVLGVKQENNYSRMLNWEQVKHLLESGVDIQSHGISHICMTRLDKNTAVNELYESKETIKRHTGHIPKHFAYPNGMKDDFNDYLRNAAAKAGYRSVASVIRGVNTPGVTSPFNLKRVGMVGNPKHTMLYIENMFAKAQREIYSK